MFKIEKLLKICETELPTLNFNVAIDDDGYRISVSRNENEGNFHKERRTFKKIIENINDLYLIKVCEGHEYILKVFVILETCYNKSNEILVIETPTRTLSFNNIYTIDYQATCQRFGIPECIIE